MHTTKPSNFQRFLPPFLLLLLLPVLAYVLGTGLLGAIDTYRSPLKDKPPEPGVPVGEPLTRRVVFVLIDGLRNDVAMQPETMPFLNELAERYGSAVMRSRAPSYSSPAYAVLFTGAWPSLSDGSASNLALEDQWAWTQDHLFASAQRRGLKTAISGYYWFKNFIPAADRDASFFVPTDDEAADRAVMAAALPWLDDPTYTLVVIHLDQVDHAGHYQGGSSVGYGEAAKRVDDYLREIAGRLDLSRDTLLVTSDHGHLDRGGHGGPEAVVTTQPFVLAGVGAANNKTTMDMVDVAPTVAVLLGLNLPASTQGRPVYRLLALSADQEARLRDLSAKQQGILRLALERATGLTIPLDPEIEDPARALDSALVDVFDTGYNWRLIGAMIVILAMAIIWWRRKSPIKPWVLAGILVYAFFNHEIYAVALGRTYSLSSAASPADLMITLMGCTALAFLLTWALVLLAVKWWAELPVPAGWVAYELTLAVLSGLLLPVLVHFTWNGLFPHRFLPDYWILFLALEALIQMMLIPVLGLLTAGAVRLIGSRAKSPVNDGSHRMSPVD